MPRQKSILFRGLLLFFFLTGACAFRVPKDVHTMVQNLPSDPENLNPITYSTVYASTVNGTIYESLFTLDPETLQPKPNLATRWVISEDKLCYTFYLREGVKWHDGKPMTADDVLYSFQKIKDPKVDAAPLRNYFKDLTSAEKIDEQTVRFTYAQPYVGALYTIGFLRVFPKHLFDNGDDFNGHPLDRAPVGTGPFRFESWTTGQKIVLVRNKNYWGVPYSIQKMVFKIFPDEQVAFQLFKKRELDMIDITPLQWAKQTHSPAFQRKFVKHRLFTKYSGWNYIGWNLRKPIFQDRRVRWALAHLVDRNAINKNILYGLQIPITGPSFPLGANYDTSLPLIEYDFEKAKRLLEEAGWKLPQGKTIREKNGKQLQFKLLFSSGLQYYERLTPILKSNFAAAGIKLELQPMEGVTMFQMVAEKSFDAYMGGWGRGAGEEDHYQVWHSSQAELGSNYIGYQNPELDHLVEAARQEFDDAKRAELNRQVHRILYEDQPYLFMFTSPDLIARDNRFENVTEYPGGFELQQWRIRAD